MNAQQKRKLQSSTHFILLLAQLTVRWRALRTKGKTSVPDRYEGIDRRSFPETKEVDRLQ